jgi:hypothetical protein
MCQSLSLKSTISSNNSSLPRERVFELLLRSDKEMHRPTDTHLCVFTWPLPSSESRRITQLSGFRCHGISIASVIQNLIKWIHGQTDSMSLGLCRYVTLCVPGSSCHIGPQIIVQGKAIPVTGSAGL